MEIEKYEPTKIVERKREPRVLQILPPSFNDGRDASAQDIEMLDGLPYIESFTEMQIANAEKVVQDEMAKMEKKDYELQTPLPECPMIDSKEFEAEIERIYRKEHILSFDHYECAEPTRGQQYEPEAWQQSIEHCKRRKMYQLNGMTNLHLYKRYNAQKWKDYNSYLREMNRFYEKEVEELQRKMNDINKERKLAQSEAKPELDKLENAWWQLVDKNNDIELQSQILRSQIEAARESKLNATQNNDAV
mmetsp:Transcript_13472/g.21207  ORF Transcript_13472/g.21207 Transcript_13472/m.21207 type:complete len:248 (-) Transcript_13472:22-765(-)